MREFSVLPHTYDSRGRSLPSSAFVGTLPRVMHLEAVTVCVGYADYLRHCLANVRHLDRWVIVTKGSDLETIDLCQSAELEWVCCERLHEQGAAFAKGKAINDGLAHLARRDWLLILDADIVLPVDLRQRLERAQLDQACLYSLARRYAAQRPEDIAKQFTPRDEIPTTAGGFYGFFQLFHASATQSYPESSASAALDDFAFRDRWPPARRRVLDLSCIHLGEVKVNWFGRTSPRFGDVSRLRRFYQLFIVRGFGRRLYYHFYLKLCVRWHQAWLVPREPREAHRRSA